MSSKESIMKKVKISGASDDLVYIDGYISEEIDVYKQDLEGTKIECSDGTKATIKYDGDWIIEIDQEGSCFNKIINSKDDIPHTDEDCLGLCSYSDVLVLNEGVEWVKVGDEKISKS